MQKKNSSRKYINENFDSLDSNFYQNNENYTNFISDNDNSSELFENDYDLNLDLFFILKRKSANLLSFSFSNNNKNCVGKSHLLNITFGKNFSENDLFCKKDNLEYQTDDNFSNPIKLNVGDYHAILSPNLFSKICDFFNYYIIHIYSEELKSLLELIENYEKNNMTTEIKTILIIHDTNENLLVARLKENIHTIRIANLRKCS